MTANRIQTYHDFGYVALDILSVRAEDAGTYTVVARNALGEAQLSASMVVESKHWNWYYVLSNSSDCFNSKVHSIVLVSTNTVCQI